MKHRIKAVTNSNGTTYYYVEFKIFLFWFGDSHRYNTFEDALKWATYNNQAKVEYYDVQ